MSAAVLLLPLCWKRLKGGTLAPAAGGRPEGRWEPQETRFTLFYQQTRFRKTWSRNGHADYHLTIDLLKLRVTLGIFTQENKGSSTWLKLKGNLTIVDCKKESPKSCFIISRFILGIHFGCCILQPWIETDGTNKGPLAVFMQHDSWRFTFAKTLRI